MFEFDKENDCYSYKLHNMIISCYSEPDARLENYAKELIEQYEVALEGVAQFICSENDFIEVYGKYSIMQVMDLLKNNMTIPWIFLQNDNEATIAYCDEDYVLEFAMDGCYMNFREFVISS